MTTSAMLVPPLITTGPGRLPRPPDSAALLRLKVFWLAPPLIVVVVPAWVLLML